jgi:glycosyltransferase involved in cell wall biosynthesis
VLVVTCDRPALLADALASVALQRPSPLEVRIADDGECPALDPVEDFHALEVTQIRSDGRQPAASRNHAARGARGEVLAFLDDDDRWTEGHLEGLARAFTDASVGVAYRDAAVVRESVAPGARRTELERRTIAHDWDMELMRHDDFIPPSGFAVRRTLYDELGGFDESFRYSEDWDFLLRAAAALERSGRAVPRRVPGVTVEVRLREQGNASAERGPERRACLDRLAARHGLAPLEIKTFWEVALAVGRAGAAS